MAPNEVRASSCSRMMAVIGGALAVGQQALGLQLLAAEADDHHLTAIVRMLGEVLQRTDRDFDFGALMATPQP